jgi:protein phosphatase
MAQHAAQGIVYVHCKVGYSRSAAVVGAFLLAAGHCATADEALSRLRESRPSIVIRPEAQAALRQFERSDHHPHRQAMKLAKA